MSKAAKWPVAMTIAGSDPGGGAGLQADLKTFAAFRIYGFSIITAVIAQNSVRVSRVQPIDAAMVADQIATLIAERIPDALKTGALANAAVVNAVAKAIEDFALPAPVVDPVLIASSGARLLDEAGERALVTQLFPLARVITPNIPEAATLSGIEIDGPSAMRAAARKLRRLGARAIVIKGGHGFSSDHAAGVTRKSASVIQSTDLLFDGRSFTEFTARRIAGDGAHGTGCAFSAAIAARLAYGDDLEAAVRKAKAFVSRALRARFVLSERGRSLLDHFAR
ncbi:MAG TPA: bifunctional hydroxymethylpyrimidine kinase/phosphomethylpyrimidine kinase [Candidatus Binataceae bacterium]